MQVTIAIDGLVPTIKDKIIAVLSEMQPLRTQSVHEEMIRRYKIKSSFQATDKSVKQLVKEKILLKEGRGLKINPSWAKALLDYATKINRSTSKDLFDLENAEKFSFNSLLEVDESINKTIAEWINKNRKSDFVVKVQTPHCYWLARNLDYDHVFVNIVKSNVKISYYNTRNLSLDKELSLAFYKKQESDFSIEESEHKQNSTDLIINYEKTIYVKIPAGLAAKLDAAYSNKGRVPIEHLRNILETKEKIMLYMV